MLKFEGKFKVGQVIKAFDFMPGRPDVADSFIVGRVVDTDNNEHGFKAYKVEIIEHIIGGNAYADEVGTEAWIPMEVGFMEYDHRIQNAA